MSFVNSKSYQSLLRFIISGYEFLFGWNEIICLSITNLVLDTTLFLTERDIFVRI